MAKLAGASRRAPAPGRVRRMFDAYLRYEWWFAAAQLSLAMFGMGATLRADDFIAVFKQPRAFSVGFVVQVVGIPLIALALNAALALPPGIAFGIILVAAMPGGAMSNVVTYFAKSNVPLSIALTAVVTLTCMVTTPLVLRLLGGDLVPDDFVMPVGAIAFDIAVCLLVPLTLGMMAGAPLANATRGLIARWCIRASLAVVLLITIGSAGAGRLDAGAYGGGAVLAVLLFAFLVQQAGTLPGLLFGLARADIGAISIETAIRNTNLALLLKASLFPAVAGVADPLADAVLFTALLFAGLAAPLTIPVIVVHRRLARREERATQRDT
jgi:BASS family bile acid:Na+ symporter